jgi:hypothetical protein
MGGRKTPDHRRRDLAAQGPVLLGAPPGQDAWRPAGLHGGEGRGLHLWAGAQYTARTSATPFGEPFDLSNCTANV